MSGPGSKVCVICGQDCSGKPRIKDAYGHYACKACVEAKEGHAHHAAPAEPEPAADDGFGLGDFYEEPQTMEAPVATMMCPGCGSPVEAEAVVCTRCGINVKTGKKSPEIRAATAGAGAKAAAAVGGAVAAPVFWTIGGLAGGLIGAGVWAAVAAFLHVELGWIAWGVGVLAGIGVMMGAKGNGGVMAGLWAAGIALVCVAAEKFGAIAILMHQAGFDDMTRADYERFAMMGVADEVIDQFENVDGRELAWPEGLTYDEAEWPDEYPPEVVEETHTRWDALARSEQDQRVHDVKDAFGEYKATVAKGAFVDDLNFFDVLWGFFAVASAFKIASGGTDET
ncbi:MAG: hypothetical protein H6810_08830 [Phycisphaeraceae bacterium]|nr:MAG: hypothetical protein H6810_08830 [Phycisphaeraceae bacterium]